MTTTDKYTKSILSKAIQSKKQSKNHYVSKEKLLELLADYKETGKISNELGECFLLMSKKLASSAYFRRYPYLDDMVQDGVLCCIRYIYNFSPEKGSPFAYFTQLIKNAFLTKIKNEYAFSGFKDKIRKFDSEGYLLEGDIFEGRHVLDFEEETEYS